ELSSTADTGCPAGAEITPDEPDRVHTRGGMSWLSTTLHDAAPLASRRACLGGLPRSHPVARDAARFFDRRGAPADDHILHRCPARERPPHLGPRGGPPLRDRAARGNDRR